MIATTQERTVALLMPAAGEGRRLGLGVPKALAEVAGRPMVYRALEPFLAFPGLLEVVVLAPASAVGLFESSISSVSFGAVAPRVVAGGATRQESVRRGLDALRSSPEIVCVHDAARPLATKTIVSAVIAAAAAAGAATAAARPVDSVRQDEAGGATRAIERSALWLVQTPQAFASELLRDAHARAAADGLAATDDASLVEKACGARIAIVPNDTPNLKVTTPADLACARAFYK